LILKKGEGKLTALIIYGILLVRACKSYQQPFEGFYINGRPWWYLFFSSLL